MWKAMRLMMFMFGILITASGCANGGGGVQVSDYDGQKSIEAFANKVIDSKLLKNIGVAASSDGEALDLSVSANMLLNELAE